MRRIALELVSHSASYRGSGERKPLAMLETPVSALHAPSATSRVSRPVSRPVASNAVFSDVQLYAALELMNVHSLKELDRQDFSQLGRKHSWTELAQGCLLRISTDLLRLEGVQEAKECADLLRRRLEARREERARTTREVQNAITTVYAASVVLLEAETLSGGELVRDVDGAVGRLTVVMRRWRSLSDLAPETAPRTEDLAHMVKAAIETVIHHPRVAEATKAVARRALSQWAPPPSPPAGERVQWDSD